MEFWVCKNATGYTGNKGGGLLETNNLYHMVITWVIWMVTFPIFIALPLLSDVNLGQIFIKYCIHPLGKFHAGAHTNPPIYYVFSDFHTIGTS